MSSRDGTEVERLQLERDGFAVVEGFLRDAECAELVAAGLELTRHLPDAPPTVFTTTEHQVLNQLYFMTSRYFMESNDKISYFYEKEALDDDGKLQVDPSISLNKVGHALHLLHPIFRCYTYSERVKALCRALRLVEPAVVQSMYIYKNPGIGAEVVPHQDISYLHTEPIPPIGFWIALEDATIENGCLWMARGSHKSGIHRRMIRSPEDRNKCIYDKPPPVYPDSSFTPLPVSKGTCVLIHGNVVHRSAANSSATSRHAYTFHVVERKDNNYSEDNWLQEGENAPFLNIYTTSEML
ncbi:phytanoyl-CoA dioxygenase domain-containing protein 1-like [Cydia amplana]|uniref:phytanoyl-CoA dioxygenase domain-containing protein 1-like n=1 Tax=Cydia amplana TaxID=1869771 RepID=UPI002FE5A2D3